MRPNEIFRSLITLKSTFASNFFERDSDLPVRDSDSQF